MSPHLRAHLARISAERVGLIPRPWYAPTPPAEVENRRRWGSVLMTLIASLPIMSALVNYLTKGDN